MPNMAVVRGHLMWMLGKSGKAAHATFTHCGPFTSQQLRLALVNASSLVEFEDIIRLTLC